MSMVRYARTTSSFAHSSNDKRVFWGIEIYLKFCVTTNVFQIRDDISRDTERDNFYSIIVVATDWCHHSSGNKIIIDTGLAVSAQEMKSPNSDRIKRK